MKRRLFAKAPDGSLVTRTTYKRYTHAVIVPQEDVNPAIRRIGSDTWAVWGWTTRMLKDARIAYKRAIAVLP
jgi:hypothetical protein